MNDYSIVTGVKDFRALISKNGLTVEPKRLFVDKSLFIKAFLDIPAEVLLVTRPRRWGKTLALSMIQHFLAAEVDGKPTVGLFKNLKIAKVLEEEPEYKEYQGQHPVIFITFKDLKGNTLEKLQHAIVQKIALLFSQYIYILDALINQDRIFCRIEKVFDYEAYAAIFTSIKNKTCSFDAMNTSLKILSDLLYRYHGKKVFILIDEYDNVLNYVYDKPEMLESLTDFFSALFGSCLKDNTSLQKGLVTGILRIAKANIFSGLNNPTEDTMLSHKMSLYYGFTESETTELLEKAGMANKQQVVKDWYNGYLVGKERLYNPWSITQCISNDAVFEPYWMDTASPTMIKDLLINKSPASSRILLANLLTKDQTVLPVELESCLSMEDIKINPTMLWSLLLHTGYLTIIQQGNRKLVRLPNYEVRLVITKYINNWFTENPMLTATANALLAGNMAGFTLAFKEALDNPVYSARIFNNKSANSQGSINLKEFMYQFLVMAELNCINDGIKDYQVIAEPENISLFRSRPDFIVVNHKQKFCVVGEIKIATEREDLKEIVNNKALAQISKNEYGIKYRKQGYKIIKLGIAFRGTDFEAAWEE